LDVSVYPSHTRIIVQKKLPAIVKDTQHQGRKLTIHQQVSNLPAMKFEQLQKWSQQAYQCLGQAAEATKERASALMRTRHV
jgi:arginine/lysine/ornithine decarboxylase